MVALPLRGGDLSVDFVNTVFDVRTGRGEHLPTPAHLAAWGLHAEALSAKEYEAVAAGVQADPTRARAQYRQAFRLRSCLTRLLAGQGGEENLRLVDRYRRMACSGRDLRQLDDHYVLEWVAPTDLALVGLRVVDAFVALVTSERIDRLSQCSGPRCGWLFIDQSPGRRRRWCSMQECGNRDKVRRFRSRN